MLATSLQFPASNTGFKHCSSGFLPGRRRPAIAEFPGDTATNQTEEQCCAKSSTPPVHGSAASAFRCPGCTSPSPWRTRTGVTFTFATPSSLDFARCSSSCRSRSSRPSANAGVGVGVGATPVLMLIWPELTPPYSPPAAVFPTISSGRTHLSNSSFVTKPSASAAAFSVVPSRCAFFAICAALS